MRARRVLVGVLGALFAGMLLYKVLHAGHLEQTAVFYVGIPAVIALTVALTARPRSATGLAMATITVGLALAGPLLGEGIVCLVFAAPLFYLIGLGVGLGIDWGRRREGGMGVLIVPLLLFGGAEGVADTAIPRAAEASASRAATDVERALAAAPAFGAFDSAFLRLGFPKPLHSTGTGLAVGDTRVITFTPRRSLGIGAVPEPRGMTMRVKERTQGRVVFEVVEDTTLARWLELREAEFTWTDARLTVRLRYTRTFDPAWYFGPIQHYAVGQAAGYLAETFGADVATQKAEGLVTTQEAEGLVATQEAEGLVATPEAEGLVATPKAEGLAR